MVKAEGGQPLFGEDSLLEEIRKLDHVVGATPFFEGVGLWKSNRLSNCIFRGIDPKTESSVSDLATYLLRDEELPALLEDRNAVLPEDREPLSQEEIEHAFSRKKRKEIYARSLDRFSKPEGDTLPQPIVVGLESLRRRNMRIGDVVTLVSFSPYDYEPKSQTFLVVGAFRTGMNDTEQWIYMPIRSAQVFLDLYNDVLNEFTFSGISVKLDDYSYADEVAAKIESLDSDYGAQMPGLGLRAYTWEQMRLDIASGGRRRETHHLCHDASHCRLRRCHDLSDLGAHGHREDPRHRCAAISWCNPSGSGDDLHAPRRDTHRRWDRLRRRCGMALHGEHQRH